MCGLGAHARGARAGFSLPRFPEPFRQAVVLPIGPAQRFSLCNADLLVSETVEFEFFSSDAEPGTEIGEWRAERFLKHHLPITKHQRRTKSQVPSSEFKLALHCIGYYPLLPVSKTA